MRQNLPNGQTDRRGNFEVAPWGRYPDTCPGSIKMAEGMKELLVRKEKCRARATRNVTTQQQLSGPANRPDWAKSALMVGFGVWQDRLNPVVRL